MSPRNRFYSDIAIVSNLKTKRMVRNPLSIYFRRVPGDPSLEKIRITYN
jgi:hypothetical protein